MKKMIMTIVLVAIAIGQADAQRKQRKGVEDPNASQQVICGSEGVQSSVFSNAKLKFGEKTVFQSLSAQTKSLDGKQYTAITFEPVYMGALRKYFGPYMDDSTGLHIMKKGELNEKNLGKLEMQRGSETTVVTPTSKKDATGKITTDTTREEKYSTELAVFMVHTIRESDRLEIERQFLTYVTGQSGLESDTRIKEWKEVQNTCLSNINAKRKSLLYAEDKSSKRELNDSIRLEEKRIAKIDTWIEEDKENLKKDIEENVRLFHETMVVLQTEGAKIIDRLDIRPSDYFKVENTTNVDLLATRKNGSTTGTTNDVVTNAKNGEVITVNGKKFKVVKACDMKNGVGNGAGYAYAYNGQNYWMDSQYYTASPMIMGTTTFTNGTQQAYHHPVSVGQDFRNGQNKTMNEFNQQLMYNR